MSHICAFAQIFPKSQPMRKSNTSTLWDLLSTLHFSLSFCTVIFKILDEVVNVNLLNGLKCDHSESFLNCVKNPKKYV
jgi:hypothetical protein